MALGRMPNRGILPGARRRPVLTIGAAAALASLALAAGVAALVSPLAGVYQGTVKGTRADHGHNAGQGWFEQKPTVFGKRVKPACDLPLVCKKAIIAPSLGPVAGRRRGCTAKPAKLKSGGFPIQRARFHHTERAPIGRHGRRLKVHFEGKWVTRTRVEGFTRIKGRRCDTGRMRWTMTSLPAP
jgi:hypothetical protein